MNMEFLSMKPYVNPHQLAIFFKRGYVMKTGLFVGEKHVFVEIIFFSEAYREFLNLLFQQSNENNPFSFLDLWCFIAAARAG